MKYGIKRYLIDLDYENIIYDKDGNEIKINFINMFMPRPEDKDKD